MTKPYTIRIPDDRKTATEHKARKLGMTFSEGVNAALEEWNGKPAECAKCKQLSGRIVALEEELDRLRRHLASISEWDADDMQLTKREDVLAAALEAATPESPVTRTDLMVLTGTMTSRAYVPGRLTVLMDAGALSRRESGRNSYYWTVPGVDIRKALLAARSRYHGRRDVPGTANGRQRPGTVPESRPAPRKPPAANVRSPANAPDRPGTSRHGRDRSAVIRTVQDRVKARGLPAVVSASELAAAPVVPVFRAGPEVDCPHEGLRGKGVCPECKQWVVRKP